MNEYLKIENAVFVKKASENENEKGFIFKVGEKEFTVYNQFGVNAAFELGVSYNLTGMGAVYYKNETVTNQLYLVEFEKVNAGAGINVIKANIQNGAIYNIAGQMVTSSYKGLVIKNGKKVIQK
jgi:hypothetical protein